jgi:hypothetical protein
MRRALPMAIAATFLLGSAGFAQQGSVQLVTASQIATGDAARRASGEGWESDLGLLYVRPAIRSGTLTVDLRGVRRDDRLRFGRGLFSIRGMKAAGLEWDIDGGDTALTPSITRYEFTNLFAPQITFRGASFSGRNGRTAFRLTAGRSTVQRNIFGFEAEPLGQTMVAGQIGHKVSSRVEVVGRASRVRTTDLEEFTYLVRSGDNAGAGIRVAAKPTLQLIADAGYVSFRRIGSDTWERQPSVLFGARWSGPRGWLQANAHRFSTGEFTAINYPHNDREGLFAAGEYQVAKRVKAYGAWDLFRTNLDPAAADRSAAASPSARGVRAYGGLRVRLNSHLFVGVRVEDGARAQRSTRYSLRFDSDTGMVGTDWQLSFGRLNVVSRYERREQVGVAGAPESTFTQHDASASLSFRLSSAAQLSGSTLLTRRTTGAGGGESYWQMSVGGQMRVRAGLSARAEAIFSRNAGLHNEFYVPRGALSAGLYGQLTRRTGISVDVLVDRMPVAGGAIRWATRTLARLTYTIPTGTAASSSSFGRRAVPGSGPSGSVSGRVFVDWNGNGVADAGEEAVEGVRLETDDGASAQTARDGGFVVSGVSVGRRMLTLDLATLAAEYEPPPTSPVISVARSRTAEASFAVLPLGRIDGVVFLDRDADGMLTPGDESINDAVVTIDGGTRTEAARNGRFRFEGIRAGRHQLQLLVESLPEGTSASVAEVEIELTRGSMTAQVAFTVKGEKRPEIRKVFPPNEIRGSSTGSRSPSDPRPIKSPNALRPDPGARAPVAAGSRPSPSHLLRRDGQPDRDAVKPGSRQPVQQRQDDRSHASEVARPSPTPVGRGSTVKGRGSRDHAAGTAGEAERRSRRERDANLEDRRRLLALRGPGRRRTGKHYGCKPHRRRHLLSR